ncbi:MAG: DTW domain-containing protein [Planctomycetales bacterium]|nr:DTW domain-containing protein [Planctomycetales bacterium]
MAPPTIIVVHPRERRSKCSVEPLRGRDDFIFWTFPDRGEQSLEGYVRLGMGGPLIGEDDASRGLLVLDGTWKLADRMEAAYAEVPVRSLPAVRTAYPRVSKFGSDPAGGLATIEAIFAAYRRLGRSTAGLLDDYYWADAFLTANEWA